MRVRENSVSANQITDRRVRVDMASRYNGSNGCLYEAVSLGIVFGSTVYGVATLITCEGRWMGEFNECFVCFNQVTLL